MRNGARFDFNTTAPLAHRLWSRRAFDRPHGERRHRRSTRWHPPSRTPERPQLDEGIRRIAADLVRTAAGAAPACPELRRVRAKDAGLDSTASAIRFCSNNQLGNAVLPRVPTLWKELEKTHEKLPSLLREQLHCLFPRIRNFFPANTRERRQHMIAPTGSAHNIFYSHSSHQQRVSNQRPMTTPWNSFSAHDGGTLLLRKVDEPVDSLPKFDGTHVLGITSK